jgi:hypothetical protein
MKISALNPNIPHIVTLLKVEFTDGINAPKMISGTGFWVKSPEGHDTLVTNKHIFDPSLKSTDFSGLKISKIMIQVRKKDEKGYTSTTELLEVDLRRVDALVHTTADTAALFSPTFMLKKGIYGNFGYETLSYSEVAGEDFLNNETEMLDPVAFIGFPQNWYDHARQAPIARLAHIASDSSAPFSNLEITSADVSLVTGLSFGGSSGSPVFLLPKGINIQSSPGLQINSPYIPGALVGIMSGHCRDFPICPRMHAGKTDGKEPESLLSPHSGLSYYTRSPSILDLLHRTSGKSIKPELYEQK